MDNDVLERARKEALLTRAELGKRLELSPQTVYAREKNPFNMRIKDLSEVYQQMGDYGKLIIKDWVDSFFI